MNELHSLIHITRVKRTQTDLKVSVQLWFELLTPIQATFACSVNAANKAVIH